MFELLEIASHPELTDRVFPVVLDTAKIFDPIARVGYVKHWEDQRRELDEAMRAVGQENLQGIRDELDLFEKIRNAIAGITDSLADLNALTPEVHRGENFERLHRALSEALTRRAASRARSVSVSRPPPPP
jgi:hypothetical protein